MSEINEIEAAAIEAKRCRAAAEETQKTAAKPGEWPVVPVAIGVGVGSAALAAVLMYTSRGKK